MMKIPDIIQRLSDEGHLTKEEWVYLIKNRTPESDTWICKEAQQVQQKNFGNKIYIRGLIEFTNYCKNNCYYCGIRRDNSKAQRYRLSLEDILSCCAEGYQLGFRTFVLQGGEDGWFTDNRLVEIVTAIRQQYPECAITLSAGERTESSYKRLYEAGANRYLLRHETANSTHYAQLHPENLSLAHRKECLTLLKNIGYQTGSGFMVGSPYQTSENIAEDMLFLQDFQPQMVGIGPFLPHKDTPFNRCPSGSGELTIFLVALLRLMLPQVLLPATTALGTLMPDGRERAIQAGANVVMPNLSPLSVRNKYLLYDNKLATGEESAQSLALLKDRLQTIGYEIAVSRGDFQK